MVGEQLGTEGEQFGTYFKGYEIINHLEISV